MSNLKQLAHDYALQFNTVNIGGFPIKQKELHDAIDVVEQENKELKQKLSEQRVYITAKEDLAYSLGGCAGWNAAMSNDNSFLNAMEQRRLYAAGDLKVSSPELLREIQAGMDYVDKLRRGDHL